MPRNVRLVLGKKPPVEGPTAWAELREALLAAPLPAFTPDPDRDAALVLLADGPGCPSHEDLFDAALGESRR